jgi:hypothetical protein
MPRILALVARPRSARLTERFVIVDTVRRDECRTRWTVTVRLVLGRHLQALGFEGVDGGGWKYLEGLRAGQRGATASRWVAALAFERVREDSVQTCGTIAVVVALQLIVARGPEE